MLKLILRTFFPQVYVDQHGIFGTLAAIGLGIAAAGSVASSAIGAHAAGSAADAQVNAANKAADLQHQDATAALDFNKQVYSDQKANQSPYLAIGKSAAANLAYLGGVLPKGATIPGTGTPGTPAIPPSVTGDMPDRWAGGTTFSNFNSRLESRNADMPLDPSSGDGGQQFNPGSPGTPGTPDTALSSLVNPALGAEGSLAQDWTGKFVAPTGEEAKQDPGYQFRLDQGQGILERSAAARGGLLSGGTTQDLTKFGQDYASNEYDKTYARRLGQYTLDYNTFKANQADKFNRLSTLTGGGQVAASTLGNEGSAAAGNNTNILLGSGAQIGQSLNNAGAARASGYVGAGNAFSSGISNIGNLGLLALLNRTTPTSTGVGMG